MVNSHLVCDPTIRQPGFDLPRQQRTLLNRFRTVPAEGNGDLQTLICVLVVRPRRCPTLSNPVPWQNWMAAYLGYTLRMKTLFRGWPVMVNDTHTRRRRLMLYFSILYIVWVAGRILGKFQFSLPRRISCLWRRMFAVSVQSVFVQLRHAKSHASRVRLTHFHSTHAFPPAQKLSHAWFLRSYAYFFHASFL